MCWQYLPAERENPTKNYNVIIIKRASCVWHSISSGREAPVLEILGVWKIPSLTLLPGPLWPGMIVAVKVPSMDQIELFENYLYLIGILNVIYLEIICIKNSYLKLNPRLSHTKDSKIVLDAALFNTQNYKARIKGKVEQSRKSSSASAHTHLGVVAIEKRALESPFTKVANSIFYNCFLRIIISYLKLYKVSKVGDLIRGQPEGSLFNSYYTEV